MNAMGFYSFCPGEPIYSIGRPVFDEVEIALANGNIFTLKASNNSVENKYVGAMKLNGSVLSEPFFAHSDLFNGSTIELEMQSTPSVQ